MPSTARPCGPGDGLTGRAQAQDASGGIRLTVGDLRVIIHVATLRGVAAGLIDATAAGNGGNVQVRTSNTAGTLSDRGMNDLVFGTDAGPTP